MGIPITQSIERRNMNVNILLVHKVKEGIVKVVGFAIVRIP